MAAEKLIIPQEIRGVVEKLQEASHEAYIVGGCVRDLLLGIPPKDWDVTTSAKPEEILKLFPESFYENKFLTVTVKTGSKDSTLAEIEITTFRAEGRYTDKRHPDSVRYADTLEEDLSRRDFTVNAMALKIQNVKFAPSANSRASPVGSKAVCFRLKNQNDKSKLENYQIIDPFDGQKDLEKKIIRAVGEPEKRFEEDALRMLRAARFAEELGFEIEEKTKQAIQKNAGNLRFIAKERIRDELVKMIAGRRAQDGIELLRDLELLKQILPELEEGIGIEQRGPHKYDVWEHNLRALGYAAGENFSVRVRLAALFHDIGKPRTRVRRGGIWTFYGHDVVGAKMAYVILTRLRFPERESGIIANLVRRHMFSYKLKRDDQYRRDLASMGEDPDKKDIEDAEDMQETTDSTIRRLIRNVGAEHIGELVEVRICDRIATGVPKAVPYRLRHFQFRVEKILREGEATNVKMLAVRGNDVMERLGIPQSPRVGHILNALLEEVLDDPAKNNRDYLLNRMSELNSLSDDELAKIRKEAEEKLETMEGERISAIKKKYYVR